VKLYTLEESVLAKEIMNSLQLSSKHRFATAPNSLYLFCGMPKIANVETPSSLSNHIRSFFVYFLRCLSQTKGLHQSD